MGFWLSPDSKQDLVFVQGSRVEIPDSTRCSWGSNQAAQCLLTAGRSLFNPSSNSASWQCDNLSLAACDDDDGKHCLFLACRCTEAVLRLGTARVRSRGQNSTATSQITTNCRRTERSFHKVPSRTAVQRISQNECEERCGLLHPDGSLQLCHDTTAEWSSGETSPAQDSLPFNLTFNSSDAKITPSQN